MGTPFSLENYGAARKDHSIPALDTDSLECREANEALFRDRDGFILCPCDGAPPLSLRDILRRYACPVASGA